MAVKIRLMRMGAKKAPFYRVVVADSRSPRDGRFLENLGIYHPNNEPSRVEIDTEKAAAWLAKGAQPTEAVAKLLTIAGVEGLAERKQAAKTLRATQAKAKAEPASAKAKAKAKAKKSPPMRDVVVYLARALVDDPERVTVEELPGARGVTYEVRTAPDDVGKLIGRGGRTVKALRRVVKAAAPRGQRVEVEVLAEGE